MSNKRLDYSIFDKFNFERKPVGVKFSLKEPEGVEPLKENLAICEMFARAQTSNPFYATRETTQCGEHIVGFVDFPPMMYSGQLGPHFSMFRDPSANRKVYDYIRVMPRDSVKYVTHAGIDRMDFDPDVLIITAKASQAEIILRASSFSNGKMWAPRGTTCLSCSWLYSYPYMTGELNYTVSGLGFSMKARGVLPDGLILIAIPGSFMPEMIDNLHDMTWEPHWFKLGREGFIQEVRQLEKDVKKELSLE
ncbi:MAG: DUF169 domain-containing protein [Dehalococcoidales bacterium]|nr:DUF169 domain-containing protein [Dehalococcoidales bacterium]